MYPPKVNSPLAQLTSAISSSVTTIPVSDITAFPSGTNLATIGVGEDAETIRYTGKSGSNLIGVTRGFEGVAKTWASGDPISRVMTAYDLDSVQSVAETAYNHSQTSHLELGETSSTAHRGDHGATAYDHSQSAHAPADANNYTLPTATSSVLGGVKLGSGINVSNGTISVATDYLLISGGTLTGKLNINSSTSSGMLNLPYIGSSNPTSTVSGDLWHRGSNLYYNNNGTIRAVAHTTQWSLISEAEIDAGTSGTSRFISASRLKYAIDQGISDVSGDYLESTHPASGVTTTKISNWDDAYTHSTSAHAPSDANNYVHPSSHPPSIIDEDSSNRFVTDSQISAWNSKEDSLGFTPIDSALIGVAGGVAELDSSGFVPSSQLPSFVDDVLEFTDFASFPSTGESGKIYVDKAEDTTYRWSGSSYVAIGSSLALGETSSTAYRGDRGKIAYDHSQTAHAPSDANNYSHPSGIQCTPATLTRGTGLSGSNYNGKTAQTWSVNFGTASGTVCEGNDSRLSDARTPTSHTHDSSEVSGLLELGTTSTSAHRGDYGNLAYQHSLETHAPADANNYVHPTATQCTPATLTRGSGLTGSNYNGKTAQTWGVNFGTTSGTACEGNDGRLSDARTPTSHNHDANDINAGTLALARIPTGTTTSTVALGEHSHDSADISNLLQLGTTSSTAYRGDYGNTAYNHVSSNGTDHTYIDQDVRTTAEPTFASVSIGDFTIEHNTTTNSLDFNYTG